MYFLTMVSIFLIISLIALLYFINKNKSLSEQQGYIGVKSNKIIQSYQTGEATLFYIDQSAKYAAETAYFMAAFNGAMASCGDYYNFKVWDLEDPNCVPMDSNNMPSEHLKNAFENAMNKALNEYFSVQQDASIPNNYDLNIFERANPSNPAGEKQLVFVGQAQTPIQFVVEKYQPGAQAPVSATGGQAPATYNPVNLPLPPAGKTDRDLMVYIKQNYGPIISKYAQMYGFPASYEPLFAGMIATESSGNTYALGFDYGSIGLTQFIDSTARSEQFSSIFEGKITSCNCGTRVGRSCPTRWSAGSWVPCSPSNDLRFDPDKNIQGGIKYVHDNYLDIKKMMEAKVGAGNANEETLILSAIMGHNRGLNGIEGDIRQAGISAANAPSGWKVVSVTGTSSYGRQYPLKVLKYAAAYKDLSGAEDTDLGEGGV